jgi:hypothetical protein
VEVPARRSHYDNARRFSGPVTHERRLYITDPALTWPDMGNLVIPESSQTCGASAVRPSPPRGGLILARESKAA